MEKVMEKVMENAVFLKEFDFENQEDYTYVVRFSLNPKLDLERNWSSFAGCESEFGPLNEPQSIEEVKNAVESYVGGEVSVCGNFVHGKEFRYHNGLGCYAQVHYEGLGAWLLEADNLEDALKESQDMNEQLLWCTMGSGDGHFYSQDVVGYIKVDSKENLYVFILE